ncbi:MAG: hypothetical protein IJ105_05015 [Bacilli bacterium]|nr:hypothetical protein [Bacilli bacterium]
MYSEEIKQYLKKKKYLLTVEEYLYLIESPQIRENIYRDNTFYISTDDGYNFSFKIVDKDIK